MDNVLGPFNTNCYLLLHIICYPMEERIEIWEFGLVSPVSSRVQIWAKVCWCITALQLSPCSAVSPLRLADPGEDCQSHSGSSKDVPGGAPQVFGTQMGWMQTFSPSGNLEMRALSTERLNGIRKASGMRRTKWEFSLWIWGLSVLDCVILPT